MERQLNVCMRLVFLLIIPCVMGGENAATFQPICIPARDCVDENVCYCGGRFDGWMNGGGRKSREFRNYLSAKCGKMGRDCECGDCGNWGAVEDVQCKESRCNDDIGVVDADRVCWHMLDSGAKVKRNYDEHFNCHKTIIPCSSTVCDYGKHLTGCKRLNPGSCVECSALEVGRFWERKGSCVQKYCTTPGPGKFIGKPCTTTEDTVMAGCSTYQGNPGYIIPRQDGKATYYCPGGGLVLPLPANAEPTPDYTNFVCIDGYYLQGSSCLPCVPGSACKYGKTYICPMHYYSSTFAMSACTRCSGVCSEWSYPVRCKQGSTANPGCMPCGGCSYDPKRGLSCVTEAYEMQGLQDTCVPVNGDGQVAVCAQPAI